MRFHRLQFILLIVLLLFGGVGCRTARHRRSDSQQPHRLSTTAISLHGNKNSEVQTDEDLIANQTTADTGKVPAATKINDPEELAAPNPLSSLYVPPALIDPEEPAIPSGVLTQEEIVHSLKGQVEFSKDGYNRIDLSGTSISNAHLRELPSIPAIDHLNISKTKISDSGLLNIGNHIQLKLLRLDGTNCTDASLASILKLTQLELLSFSNTTLSDRGLEQLAKSKTLRFLLLDNTHITDSGLNSLGFIKTLEGVSLLKTNVSKEAVERLRLQLPTCSIVYDGSKPNASAFLQDGHSTMHSVSFQDDSSQAPLRRLEVPEWLNEMERSTTTTSQAAASEPRPLPSYNNPPRVEQATENLPLIHPLHRNYMQPNSSYGWANDSRPNQQGYLGARQSMTPAQAAARVGFTSPAR